MKRTHDAPLVALRKAAVAHILGPESDRLGCALASIERYRVSAADQREDDETRLAYALVLIDARQFAKAEDELRCVRAAPSHPGVNTCWARLHMSRGDYRSEEDWVRQHRRAGSPWLADCLRRQGRLMDADTEIRAALAEDPAEMESWGLRVETLRDLGRLVEASQVLSLSKQHGSSPELVELENEIATAQALQSGEVGLDRETLADDVLECCASGRVAEAHARLDRAKILWQEEDPALRALVLAESYRFTEAEDILRQLSLGGVGFAYRARAALCRNAGRFADEEVIHRAALIESSETTTHWILLGSALAIQGKHDEALEIHRHATTLRGDPDEAWLNVGLVLRAQCRFAEAREAFQEALRLCPQYPAATAALHDVEAAMRIFPFLPRT